jgi:hypothetical protein
LKIERAEIVISLETPESQEILEKILANHKTESGVDLEVEITSKKLIPYDVLVTLGIQVAGKLIYDVVQRLVKEFLENKIKFRLSTDNRQILAESLLVKNRVPGYRLEERIDLEDSSRYKYVDKKGKRYHITVSSNGLCTYRAA